MRIARISAAALSAVIPAGVVTAACESPDRDPYRDAARQRCEGQVLDRLVSPESAKLVDVDVRGSELDPEVTDLSSLSTETLKDVQRQRITVRSVTGVVQAPNAFGESLNDPFTCRAYFVDGELRHTMVVFEHDH
ncbi:MAG: hypothetical protein ACKOQ4_16070 [Mycobacterium sp.]